MDKKGDVKSPCESYNEMSQNLPHLIHKMKVCVIGELKWENSLLVCLEQVEF